MKEGSIQDEGSVAKIKGKVVENGCSYKVEDVVEKGIRKIKVMYVFAMYILGPYLCIFSFNFL